MRKRRRTGDDAIDVSEGSRFSALGDALWSAQDRLRTGASQALEWIAYAVRRWLVWPLQDRSETAGAPVRALGVGVLVLAAAGAGVAALLWAAPDGGKGGTTAVEVAAVQPRANLKASEPAPAEPEPTLQGAAPVFESEGPGGVAAEAGGESAAAAAAADTPSSSSSDAGAENSTGATVSSQPDAAADSASSSASKQRQPRGPAAGPKAVAVARDFATAFVSYEIGGAEDPGVQDAFAATTTPELSQALLQRPPRLPANVEVPKAKVLNIVPAPSHGRVFPVSVSLLRVGTTSELRLEMEKLKGKRWRVTNVLG